VTFKDLQKLVQSQDPEQHSQQLRRLRDKPFWIWDPKQHKQEDIKTKGDCCFNHIIGLPKKDGNKHGNITGDKMPLVSIVKDYKELSSTYGKEKLPASFKDMERHGLRIINYTTNEV